MLRRFSALGFATAIAVSFAGSASAQNVIPSGAQWEKVSSVGKGFAEGVVAAKDGSIYLVDIAPPGTLFRYDPKTGQTNVVMEQSGASGLHIDRNGDLLMAQNLPGMQRVIRRNLTTGAITVLADKYEGKPLVAPNDLTTDSAGRIYFTDARYNQTAEPESPNAVYRLDPDGKLTRLTMDIQRPNGIEVSPDGTRLYVSGTGAPHLKPNPHGPMADKFGITRGGVVQYDLDASGNLSNGRLFFKTEVAGTDGMAMDNEGNLYVSAHANPARLIVALDPSGKVIQEFPLPEGLTTNLGFGRGEDAGSLYVSTAAPWGLWRIKTNKSGFYMN